MMPLSETPPVTEPRSGSGEMFDRIAPRYDLLNRIISLGIDQGWRRRTVEALSLTGQAKVLDLATGTADMALLIAQSHPDASVLGVDPSERMLEIGRKKVEREGLSSRVQLERGNAEALTLAEGSFDAIAMAFGIRNVPNRAQALREMVRILRPGGRAAILELSEPPPGALGALARMHVHHVVPWIGGLLSGVREYRYLQQSIAAFPPAEEFQRQLEDAGFCAVNAQPLTFGVCHLYVGTRHAV